ncbi:MAG: ABC transporter substrate-binding protein [Candidatus Bathyarchaeia archaeon]
MKKSTLTALLIVALMFPLIAVPMVHAQEPTDLKHLILDTIGEPQDIDPAWAYDTASAELLMNIYEPLLWFNRTEMATYIPRLAVSWTLEAIDEVSPEGLEWKSRVTFKLRVPENGYAPVYFHSDGVNDIPGEGAQLTAVDVEYTFERLLITDAATGPSWMVWEPLTGGYAMSDLNETLTDLGWPVNETTGWNTMCDEAIDHAIQQNGTHIWFNLIMPYEPFLQIVAQNWGGILNKDWCVWHGDWPGMEVGDDWYLWHDPETSPLYSSDPSAPGPNLDAALGTGPYMLDYWNKGSGNAWSIIKNPNYWMGWDTPFHPEGWPAGVTINGHVERFTSNYIPEWTTRRLRFLGGVSDFCAVPRMYMGQVLGQPGIDCIYPLPVLACDAFFFNFLVKDTSTHLGRVLPNGTFAEDGCPPNIFEDQNVRLAFAHMFDYTTFLYAAFLNEAVSPPTPIIPGLAYHDPSIGQTENPALGTKKKYGISFEPPDTEAYNLTLAVKYLQQAWGGQLWANGFTMDAVYNEGNLARQIAATLIKDAFDWINAHYGTKFTVKVTSIPWGAYRTEQRARVMPYFIVGWLADYPDAHNFAHPFMHSTGAFSRWQGYKGVTSFPNEEFDTHIEQGINTLNPAERQGNYTWLQQHYVDFAPGFVTAQAAGRHFERDWVEGWYYNPIYPGNYVYDLWKAIAVTPKPVDVAVTAITSVKTIEIGYPYPDNKPILPFPSPIEVDVERIDTNTEVPAIQVIIGLGLRNVETGREIILDVDLATLTIGESYTAEFYDFIQDPNAPIEPGTYVVFAQVLVISGFAYDSDASNNKLNDGTVEVGYLVGDVNVDGSVDMADISIAIDAFMTYPGHPAFDFRCDVLEDLTIDMGDISFLIDLFMVSFDP